MKVLVDTSIWIDHLHATSKHALENLLQADEVCTHSCVIGELACGTLKSRGEVLELLQELPRLDDADFAETILLIEQHRLFGCGLGWCDAQILSSCLIEEALVWTRDKALFAAASKLKINYSAV